MILAPARLQWIWDKFHDKLLALFQKTEAKIAAGEQLLFGVH